MVNDKINPEDTIEDIIVKLSDGNPGAVTALNEVMKNKNTTAFMNFALQLDTLEVYGPNIWRVYKDHCGQDASEFFNVVMNRNEEIRELL